MKYIGSKAKVAADIVPILQGYINEYGIKQYVEPFVGGFNIIDKIECKNRRLFANSSKLAAKIPRFWTV